MAAVVVFGVVAGALVFQVTAPSGPRSLEATPGDTLVTLTWQVPDSDGGSPITGYRIHRATSRGLESFLAAVEDVLTYADAGPTNGVTYYYQVSALNRAGEGPRSNEASSTPATIPSAPRSLQATAGDAQVALSWQAPSSDGGLPVSNYRIFRDISAGGGSLLTTLGDVLTYADTGLTNGVTVYYQVSAVTAAGEGPRSNEASATPVSAPTFTCIPSGDQRDINAKLRRPGDVAVLCARAVFELTAPVVLSADGQRVYTEGLPTDDRRAVLRLASGSVVSAVFMLDRSDVVLSNVIVDGNRPNLGPLQGHALIQAGGSASGQVIREVKALETRSWSTIHVFEGGPPRCSGARVENNEIGPAGRPDGNWADGISFACTNSVVRNNTIIDATDGAIVVFGAPGSLIEGNVIRAESQTLLGGINMVDFGPYEGNYTGTRVHGNVIDAAGAVIRIGMGMGSRVWGCLDPNDPTDYTLFGAVVTENVLRGDHMQYGFAVDGVRDWTVMDNVDLATHSGTPTVACNGRVASPPAGFQYHSARASGVFQSEFTEADLELALWAVEEPRP